VGSGGLGGGARGKGGGGLREETGCEGGGERILERGGAAPLEVERSIPVGGKDGERGGGAHR